MADRPDDADANERLIREFYATVFAYPADPSVVDTVVATSFRSHDWSDDIPSGPAGFRMFYDNVRTSLPEECCQHHSRSAVHCLVNGLESGLTEDVTSHTNVEVLLVDDQEPFRVAARAVLSRLPGFDVAAEAESGEQAVELVAEQDFDLVLMDINMAGMNGLEATRLITDRLPSAMVVLMSTYAVEDLPAEAQSCGAVAYINKEELSPRQVLRVWEAGGDPEWEITGC